MKKFTFILSFVLIHSLKVFSQEHYIEVLVKDTLLVEPQRWTLLINIEKQYDYTTMSDTTVAYIDSVAAPSTTAPAYPKPKEGTLPDDIKTLIKKFKGTVSDDIPPAYNMDIIRSHSESESSFRAQFSNRKAMEDFLKAILVFNDVKSLIVDTYHAELQRYENQLESKLMSAAKQKAARLAQLSNRKAGMVILVSEATQSETNPIQDLIENLIKYDGFGSRGRGLAYGYFSPDKIKLEKMLKVRFAIE